MSDKSKQGSEVIVKVLAARLTETENSLALVQAKSSDEVPRTYDALIYSDLDFQGYDDLKTAPCSVARAVSDLPLKGVAEVTVRWDLLQQYQKTLLLADKAAATKLSTAFFETRSSVLQTLFTGQAGRRVRMWWTSDSPDLACLPWELMACGKSQSQESLFSFVRGLPPEVSMPKIPLSGPLRLALIYEPLRTSKALLTALDQLSGKMEVIKMNVPPREALAEASLKGYEIIHLVTDGTVSLAHEGILYLRKSLRESPVSTKGHFLRALLPLYEAVSPVLPPTLSDWALDKLTTELDIEPLSSNELFSILRGSRVGLLSLSAPVPRRTSSGRTDSYLLPSVYRAFVGVGRSSRLTTNIVAQLGGGDKEESALFWRNFYLSLAESLSVEQAMMSGMLDRSKIAFALFLRQKHVRTFKQVDAAQESSELEPTQINAALQLSRRLMAKLEAQQKQFGPLPESVNDFIRDESIHQEKLAADLDAWIGPEEGDSL